MASSTQPTGPRLCHSGWPFARGSEQGAGDETDSHYHGSSHQGLPIVAVEQHGAQTQVLPSGRHSARGQDAAHLVQSMQRMLGPWLQAHIEHSIMNAVEKAAKGYLAPPAPASTAPSVTIEAIGRRIDEAMRIAITKAQMHPHPALMPPDSARESLTASQERGPRMDSPKPCMASGRDGLSSPKPAHITVDREATVIQMPHQGENARYGSPPTSPAAGYNGSSTGRSASKERPRPARQESLPTLMPRARGNSQRTLGETTVMTGTTLGAQTQEEGYNKALVVNFRRLIEIKEKLDIIHEVIKATTIALLTLLAVSNGFRLAYDLGFLVCGIALYALHEMSHDALDIDDYKRVVGLLGNDGEDILAGSDCPGGLENPNRCIQALSYSRCGRRKFLSASLLLFFVVLCTGSWGLVWNVWVAECNWYCTLGWTTPDEGADIEHYVTLLVVGTLMLLCHFIYEGLYYREFKYIMPAKDDGNGRKVPWDLDKDGIPRGNLNWLFGLPCVWFSSRAAYEDLRIWVTLCSGIPTGSSIDSSELHRRQHTVQQVFFEEMAVYALEDCVCAARLRRSLLASKAFDKQSKRFLRRKQDCDVEGVINQVTMTKLHSAVTDGTGQSDFLPVNIQADEIPEELGIELLFYDNRSGEVWIPSIPEEREDDAPMRLRHAASLNKQRSFFTEMTR